MRGNNNVERFKSSPSSIEQCASPPGGGRVSPVPIGSYAHAFKSATSRFPPDSLDSRPWYCDTPSFHESIRPKSQLSPTPSHAPFFQSAARFKTDKPAFKAPAPNAYLPPVMNKVRWSGILTGYHGIPTCYNIVDRNCDLSKVHMHCVMCPPRGIYSKSIGFPLNEIYPDDKVRDEQLRHMCSWHAGTIKRAYHDRGILAKGCTEGLQGRTEVGPPTIKSDNVGCACIRRSNLGTLDDVTLEKMAAALNSKKRDPDLSQPIALCQKFAKKELNTPEGNAAAKLAKAMEQAEECKKRCQEYTKKKEKEAEAAEKNALLAEAAKRKPFTPTSRPSRKGETAEPRLESVTEIVDESPRQTGKVCRESEMEEISKKSYTPRSSGAASSRMAKPPSIVSSRNSSRGAYDQQADFASEKSCATYQDSRCGCRDDGAVRDKTPRISADNGYPETINETSQEGTATESCGLQIRTASDATVRSSSMADGEETFSASSRRRSVVDNNAQDENCEITELNTEQQNVELNSQDCTGVGGNTFRPVVCPPIKIDCKCSLYNKGPSANGSQNGTQNAPQFGQPGYEPQGQQCAPSGQYGAQAQQYSAQYQQFGAKGQQQTCVQSQPQAFAQNQQQYYAQGQQQTFAQGQRQNCAQGQQQTFAQGQQYGAQGQQYGAQNQQIGAQNQQFGAQNQQFGAQNQQIGAQNQQYCAPGQQYGALNQSGQTYAARVKLCFPPVGQTAGTNTTQNCPQGQQYGQQGQQGFPETLVAHVCPFPSGVPPSSPKDPSQSSNTR